jgi:hypothetical protein
MTNKTMPNVRARFYRMPLEIGVKKTVYKKRI